MRKKEWITVWMSIGIALIFLVLIIIGIFYFIKLNEKKNTLQEPLPTTNQSLYYETNEEGSKVNTSKQFNKTKKFQDYTFENIFLSQYGTETVFQADCTNNTGKTQPDLQIEIIMIDKKGNEKNRIMASIKGAEAGEKVHVYAATDKDIIESYDFKVNYVS